MAAQHGYVMDVARVLTGRAEEIQMLQDEVRAIFCPASSPFDLDKELRLIAEEELGEDPDRLRYQLEELKRLIAEDDTLLPRTDEVFLAAYLRGRKHDVAKAFQCMKNSYEFKAKYPEFYSYILPSQRGDIFEQHHMVCVPGTDRKGRRICGIVPGRIDLDQFPLSDTFKIGTSLLELMLCDLQLQVTGLVVIFDLAELTIMQQARMATPRIAWHLAMIVQDKIPIRVKAIHILNQPFYFNALYAVFKPFLKKKLRKRIFIHGNDMSSLHKQVSPDNLPAQWGGRQSDISSISLKTLLHMNEHKFKEWREFKMKICK